MARRKKIYGKKRKRKNSPFKFLGISARRKKRLQERVDELRSQGKSQEEIELIMKKDVKQRTLDRLQTKLSFLGVAIPMADGVNALISAGRAGYAKYKGDDESYKKHRNAAAWNAAAIIPGVGEAHKLTNTAIKTVNKVGNVGYWTGTMNQVLDDLGVKDVTGQAKDLVNKEKEKNSPNWSGANVKQVINKYGV